MTDEDLALLLFMSTYCVQNGHPPTHREIALARGRSVDDVKATIQRLRAEGHLRKLYRGDQRHLRAVRGAS